MGPDLLPVGCETTNRFSASTANTQARLGSDAIAYHSATSFGPLLPLAVSAVAAHLRHMIAPKSSQCALARFAYNL